MAQCGYGAGVPERRSEEHSVVEGATRGAVHVREHADECSSSDIPVDDGGRDALQQLPSGRESAVLIDDGRDHLTPVHCRRMTKGNVAEAGPATSVDGSDGMALEAKEAIRTSWRLRRAQSFLCLG